MPKLLLLLLLPPMLNPVQCLWVGVNHWASVYTNWQFIQCQQQSMTIRLFLIVPFNHFFLLSFLLTLSLSLSLVNVHFHKRQFIASPLFDNLFGELRVDCLTNKLLNTSKKDINMMAKKERNKQNATWGRILFSISISITCFLLLLLLLLSLSLILL